jgi:hypothetical protein
MSQPNRVPNPVKPSSPRKPRPPRPSAAQVTKVECDRAVKGTGAEWFVTIWQGTKLSTY